MSDPVGNELVQVIGVSSTRAAASTTEFFTTQQIANLGGNASGPVRTITSGTTDSSLQTDGLIQWLSSSKSSKTQVINAGTVNGQTLEINDGTGNASQYPITLVGNGSITIGGSASLILLDNFFTISLKWDNIANWIITSYYNGSKSTAQPSYLLTESGDILTTESGSYITLS